MNTFASDRYDPCGCNRSSSASSSDSSEYTPICKCSIMPSQSKFSIIEQDAPSKAPMLLPREITPKVMCEFEEACIGYFENKEIALDKQVHKVLAELKDDHIKEWLFVDCDRISKLGNRKPVQRYSAFHKEIRLSGISLSHCNLRTPS
jgi:hypothetical protein